MECKKEQNKTMCNCSFHCSKMGMCCECVNTTGSSQLPAYFRRMRKRQETAAAKRSFAIGMRDEGKSKS